MPIHDYQCRRCAHRFEEMVKQGETPACPACGAADPEQLFSCSAAVSTGRTRELALAAPRRRAGAEKRDKDMAHAEYLRKHNEDHS